ncbi:MAG: hypothetical protein AAGI54_11095 [Planctomycetota bacterium]
MKRPASLFPALSLAIFLGMMGCATSDSAAVTEENARLKQEVAELRAELEAERSGQPRAVEPVATATPASDDRAALEARIQAAEREIEDLQAERDQLELLAGVSSKGEAVESSIALISERYDAKANRTWVTAKARPIRPDALISPADHFLGATFSYPGNPTPTPASATELQLVLYTLGNPTPQYEGFRRVTLEIDGQPTELRIDRYRLINEERMSKPTGRRSNTTTPIVMRDERLDMLVDDETVRRIARASRLRMLLPNGLKFDLGRDGVALFAAMQARRPASP